MQYDKSPGNDGLTKEFYETFLNELKEISIDSGLESKEKGHLSKSQEIHTKLKTHCAALFLEHFFRRAPPKLKKYLLQRHKRKRSNDYFTNGLFLSHGG